jgi:predicted nucleotidyltransferase
MDQSEAIKLAKEYKRQVLQHFDNIEEIILYGSYSRGTQHKDSDIDIAVVTEDYPPGDFFDNDILLFDLSLKIDSRIEPNLIVRKDDKLRFLDEIKRTGIVI